MKAHPPRTPTEGLFLGPYGGPKGGGGVLMSEVPQRRLHPTYDPDADPLGPLGSSRPNIGGHRKWFCRKAMLLFYFCHARKADYHAQDCKAGLSIYALIWGFPTVWSYVNAVDQTSRVFGFGHCCHWSLSPVIVCGLLSLLEESSTCSWPKLF